MKNVKKAEAPVRPTGEQNKILAASVICTAIGDFMRAWRDKVRKEAKGEEARSEEAMIQECYVFLTGGHELAVHWWSSAGSEPLTGSPEQIFELLRRVK